MLFFDRPGVFQGSGQGEKAVLVHIDFPDQHTTEDLVEFEHLVVSAGVDPVAVVRGRRRAPHPKYFIGEGKLEELAEAVQASGAEVVLFNHALKAAQEKNLETRLNCTVLDRTGLILDIFAQRARTFEGRLQVELAQLQHLATRLVRGWTHLERQKGGIGLRGPGETQLETDRRLVRNRIKVIERRLQKVQSQRQQGRRARRRSDTPTLSLVGYTNAGKSTLFNSLTASDVYAADQLFATLDPTLRRLDVESVGEVVLADTVGFIRHLPHQLVDAFKGTLEETVEARLLLHVVDAASDEREDNIAAVEQVLSDIGAGDIPVIQVFNKIDLMGERQPSIERDETGKPVRVWLSASTGVGVDLLLEAIREHLSVRTIRGVLSLPAQQAGFRAALYEAGAVQQESHDAGGNSLLNIALEAARWNGLLKRQGLTDDQVFWQEKPQETTVVAQPLNLHNTFPEARQDTRLDTVSPRPADRQGVDQQMKS